MFLFNTSTLRKSLDIFVKDLFEHPDNRDIVTKITNKIHSLTIIIRSYTFGDSDKNQVMLDQNKKRIFDLPKIEYTLRTIKSVIKSCEQAKKFYKDLQIKILITDDKSNKENLIRISEILKIAIKD